MLQLSDNSTTITSLDQCFDAFPRIDLFHEKRLLVTEGQHVVSVHNTADNMPVRCWTFSQIKPLSCPVVYDRIRKKFVAVLSKNEVRIFAPEEEIDDSERYKFQRTICCILTNPYGEPIVLFQDGSISLLSAALANRSEETSPYQKMEDIVRVKALISDRKSTHSRYSVEVVILTRPPGKELMYNRLKIDPETQMVDYYESFSLPTDFVVFDVADDGAFGGFTRSGEVIVIRDGSKSSATLDIPASNLQNARSFIFFPQERHVVALVHEVYAGAFVISAFDMRYGTSESYPLECMPLMNGIEIWEDRMFVMTAKGIIEKQFSVTPKSLSSIFGGAESDAIQSKAALKRPLSDDIDFEAMSTDEIIKTMKRQRTSAGVDNEKRMARLVQHMISHDPELKAVSTDQLIEQIIRMPFSSPLLAEGMRSLQPRLEAKQGLLVVNKFLDRLDEHDQYGIACVEICNSILDVCLTQILMQKHDLNDLLLDLWDRSDRFTEYCRSTLHLKSMIDSMIGPARIRLKQGKPEYELSFLSI